MKTLYLAACIALLAAPVHADDSKLAPRPASVASNYETGKKFILARDWHRAVQVLERAAKADPRDADVQTLLGYSYGNLGQLERAFGHFARALELNPGHLGAHQYVGELWLSAGSATKAREHLAALQKLCPAACKERDDLARAVAEYDNRRGPPPTR